MNGRRVLVGVCGGIAAYKACELTRMLQRRGAEVQVVLTPRAAQFVTPLTFSALTLRDAPVDEFPAVGEPPRLDVYSHLNLTRGIDCYVIAPATATTLAKLATGQADNLVTGSYLSCTAPVVIAPAMNTRMWQHIAVQEAVAKLKARGHVIVEPGEGELGCGDVGPGRLAELGAIVAAIEEAIGPRRGQPLAERRIVVTAGGTREYLDPVRFVTNASTGRLACEVAAALMRRGALVNLIDTGVSVPAELAGQLSARHAVRTGYDLQRALADAMPTADALIMLAAVADYAPSQYATAKHKKDGQAWMVELCETQDILAQAVEGRREGQVFIGVSLEDADFVARSVGKCEAKGAQMMLAVELGGDLPFGEGRLHCALVGPAGVIAPPATRDKREVAELIAGWLVERLAR